MPSRAGPGNGIERQGRGNGRLPRLRHQRLVLSLRAQARRGERGDTSLASRVDDGESQLGLHDVLSLSPERRGQGMESQARVSDLLRRGSESARQASAPHQAREAREAGGSFRAERDVVDGLHARQSPGRQDVALPERDRRLQPRGTRRRVRSLASGEARDSVSGPRHRVARGAAGDQGGQRPGAISSDMRERSLSRGIAPTSSSRAVRSRTRTSSVSTGRAAGSG